ncbi:MAG: GNAT family N-acetyltransferase [Caldisericia bacterium]|nr:GNAT family N-acetyltransferase [Caldisericia bacterium]
MDNMMYRVAEMSDVQEIAELTFRIVSEDIETRIPYPCTFSGQKVSLEDEIKKIEEYINDPAYTLMVATCNGKIAGVLYLFEESYADDLVPAPHSTIEAIFIHPDFRKQGIGKDLMKEAEKVALQKNHAYIDLQVWENNSSAFKLYENSGFCTVEKRMVKRIKQEGHQ